MLVRNPLVSGSSFHYGTAWIPAGPKQRLVRAIVASTALSVMTAHVRCHLPIKAMRSQAVGAARNTAHLHFFLHFFRAYSAQHFRTEVPRELAARSGMGPVDRGGGPRLINIVQTLA